MIKKIFFSFFIFLSFSFFAQAPQGINYQGVARTNAGAAMSKTNIALEFKLWQGNPNTGSIVYSETHTSVLTDTFGLYSLVIGSTSGSGIGTFNAVPWSGGNIWVEVYIDPANGTSYSLVAQQQLMSAPYALYAQTSGSGGAGVSGTADNIPKINPTGNGLKKSLIFESADSSSIGINTSTPFADAVLDIVNTGTPGSAGKGLLIPRMTFAERNAISVSALHHGLLVFQVNSPNGFTPSGFWYYDALNTAWHLLSPAQATWTLGGNFVGAGNFFGTLNFQDLIIKTNNTESMRVLAGGNVQFGNSGSSTHYIFPPAIGAAGDILQVDPSGTNNLVWKSFTGGGSSPWIRTNGEITPAVLSDTVGIGTFNPQGTLDIFSANSSGALNVTFTGNSTSPAINFQTQNVSNGSAVMDISTAGSGEAIRATSIGGTALSGVAQGGSGLWVQNNSGGGATVDAENLGGHSAGYFHNSVTSGTAPTLYAITADPSGYAAEFAGGLGMTTNGFQLSTGPGPKFILQSDAVGNGTWVDPFTVGLWKLNGSTITPSVTGNVGIGTSTASYPLTVTGTSTATILFAQNFASGDAISGTVSGSGYGVAGYNSGSAPNGSGIAGISTGTAGTGGFFRVSATTNTSPAIDASNQGKGSAGAFSISSATNSAAGLDVSTAGTGPSLLSTTSGTGSAANFQVTNSTNTVPALNVSTNGTGAAGSFLVTNNTSTTPALQVSQASNAPAFKAQGGTGPSAVFMNGPVGIAALMPSSGLDVKTSMGVSVKKWLTTNNALALNDQNVVHMAGASGNTTFNLPDASMCPGRLLIFTVDGTTNTGGQIILTACCGQNINGAGSQSFVLTISGVNKTSIGVVSDGLNWSIIF